MSLSKYESTIKKGQGWLKIAAAIDELVRECLLPLLHHEDPYQALVYTGLPRDQKALFAFLSDAPQQVKINILKHKRILHADQLCILFPASNETDSTKFDMTLITQLVRTFSGLTTLNGMWRDDLLDPTDNSLASFVVKVLALRNRLFHWASMTTMPEATANDFWREVAVVAHGLQYVGDISRFKTISLDPDNVMAYKLLYQGVQQSCDQQKKDHDNLKNNHDILKTGHDNLKTDHNILKTGHANLRTDHDILKTDHDNLRAEDDILKADHGKLRTDQNILKTGHANLRTDHDILKTDHDNLKIDDDILKTDHDNLRTDHNILRTNHYYLETDVNHLKIGHDILKTDQDILKSGHVNLQTGLDNLKTDFDDLKTDQNNLKAGCDNLKTWDHAINKHDKYMATSQEVLQFVSSRIGKDWERLANCLELNLPVRWTKIWNTIFHTDEKNMLRCFRKRDVTWHELKNGLKNISRNDIIQDVSARFNFDDDSIHCQEYKTDDLWYTIQSHGSVEISDVSQQSKVKILKGDDRISYLSGGNAQNTITLEEWDKRCIKFYHRYFSEYRKLTIPPTRGQTSTLDEIAKKLTHSLDSQDKNFYLFTRYDVINHMRMHLGTTETYEKVLKDLLIDPDEELECSDNRMLLFIPDHKLLLNIRITEDTDMNAIHNEEVKGRSDLKLIFFLHQRLIKCSGIVLANIVFTPNISLDDNDEFCTNCLIIDQKILNSENDMLGKWLNTEVISKFNLKDETKNTDDLIKIISAVFGFIGTRQVNVNDNATFPKFRAGDTYEGDEHNQIINLIFTYDQSRALEHPALKKMVFGGFGAGKSIVGEYQLKELAKQEANTRNHIFYICWDDNSLLYLQMKSIIQSIKQSDQPHRFNCYNRRDLVEMYLGLSKIPRLSELFQMIKERCGEDTVHIIIDEFDQENLDNYEAENLDTMFKTEEWKPSLVLFLPQSLEKERKIMSGGEVLKGATNAYKSITEMVCFTLGHHMRSTISNYLFTKCSTDIITCKVKNSIRHVENPNVEEMETYVLKNQEDWSSKLTTTYILNEDQTYQIDHEEEFRLRAVNSYDSLNSSASAASLKPFQLPIPLDEVQSFGESSDDCSNRTESTYSCRRSKICHNIKGTIPQLIYLHKAAYGNVNCTCMLAMTIKKLCMNIECERLFLCKSKESFLLITNILRLLKEEYINYHPFSGYNFVDEKGRRLKELPKTYNLITDNKGAKGLECTQGIVFVGNDDINEQQAFLEMASRCTSELFVVYPHQLNINEASSMPPVLYEIMKTAIQEKLMGEIIIKDIQLDDTLILVRQEQIDGKKYFHINHESGEYKTMCSEMKQLVPIYVSENRNAGSPFDAPQDLKCMFIYDNIDDCNLTWKDGPYDSIVKKKKLGEINWEYISKPISESTYNFKDLIKGEDYNFSVVSLTTLGESMPSQIPWKHVDLVDVIRHNDLERLKSIVDMHPWRARDENLFGYTLYHEAVYYNRPHMLSYLLSLDDKYINKCGRWNDTPLHYASRRGSIDCVKVLLSNGGDLMMKDVKGKTALDLVCADTSDRRRGKLIKETMIEHYMMKMKMKN